MIGAASMNDIDFLQKLEVQARRIRGVAGRGNPVSSCNDVAIRSRM